jgi:tetratricopeptide (TPR) repeat protein
MNPRMRILVELALATGLLVPVALAQKPPAPTPPPSTPPPTSPSHPATPTPSSTPSGQPREDLVMFLLGRVATDDGTPVPHDALVERVCNARVRQQVYATSRGDFSMDLGSMAETYLDASGDGSPQYAQSSKVPGTGIPRVELTNCELRAAASGFQSRVVSLVELTPLSGSINVGDIVVHRATKIKGTTLSAVPYKAPRDASKEYEKGLEAERNGRLADARQYFEKAVEIYPKYAIAWFQLGAVLQNLAQKEPARTAYTHATTIDSKFLPPYLSLASMAYDARDWPEVLDLTNHVLGLDPLNYDNVTGYILDLDPLDYAEAYFYNSTANYKLNKIEAAEKSGLKAERLDVRPRFPQLHLLLAEIFARKNDYAIAISESKIYLELVPLAKDADQVRERLAKWEKLNDSASTSENPDMK